MNLNKFLLTAVTMLIPVALAGLVSQIGLMVSPLSEKFDIPVTNAAAQFSWFLGGMLAGNLLSLAVLRYFKIKHVILACYAAAFLAGFGFHTATSFFIIPLTLLVIGVSFGIGVCAASTVIAEIWDENRRSSLFVAQDAFFNSGGMLFPFITAALIASGFIWSWGYLLLAFLSLFIVLLTLPLNFGFERKEQELQSGKTEWHFGLTIAGAGLFLALMGKLMPIIWLPTFLESKFEIARGVSAILISKIYLAGLIGAFLSAFIVAKMKIQYFIAIAVIMGCVSLLTFAFATTMGWITIAAYAFGLAIAAIYHSFLAWGVSYIQTPNYRHVTFMYLCGGLGGAVAPYVSGKLVEWVDMSAVFVAGGILYALILTLMVILYFYSAKTGEDH